LAIGYTNWRTSCRNKAAIEDYRDSVGTKAEEEILLGIWTWEKYIHRSKTQQERDKYKMALYADKTFTILHKYDTGGFLIKGIHYRVINGKWEKIGKGKIKLHYEWKKIRFDNITNIDNNITNNRFSIDSNKTNIDYKFIVDLNNANNIFISQDKKLKE